LSKNQWITPKKTRVAVAARFSLDFSGNITRCPAHPAMPVMHDDQLAIEVATC